VRLNETPDNTALYTQTQNVAKQLDDSRQTTGAIVGGDYATTNFQQDVFSYNDYHAQMVNGTRLPILNPPRTEWPFLVSETIGTLSGPAKFFRRNDSVIDQQGQAVAHGLVQSQAAADPRYCGVIGWCGLDYPSGSGNEFQGVKYPGVIDEFRVPKLGAAIYASQVDPNLRVVIEPSFYWDFTGVYSVSTLGSEAIIWSNANQLQLIVGGKPFAKLSPTNDKSQFGNLKFPPFIANFNGVDNNTRPDLQIDAYLNEKLVRSRLFSSNPSTDQLSMVADDSTLVADGSDMTRVVFRIVDAYGAPRPSIHGSVQLQLTGPAIIVGENPFPLGEAGGVGAIWIRTKQSLTGEVVLTAKHTTLDFSAKVTIVISGGNE